MSEPLFKKVFGRERDEAGKRLDHLLLTCILAVALIELYACYD